MFGRQYARHLDLLMHSFGEMNHAYQLKVNTNKHSSLMNTIKSLYITLFGIPEIGFQLRSIYFKKILTSFIFPSKPKKILDAGSGIGVYTFWLARTFSRASVTGGDIDRNKLKSCRVLAKEFHLNNVFFRYFDITKTQKKSVYDLIVTIDVLEHVQNYEKVLQNFHRLLQKGGILYIHVPQPHQKRIFPSLRKWHHDDHVREGVDKKTLEDKLEKLGFRILVSRETFGFFGKLAWELNHLMLTRSFILAGTTFPFLYIIALLDLYWKNECGLGVAILAKK